MRRSADPDVTAELHGEGNPHLPGKLELSFGEEIRIETMLEHASQPLLGRDSGALPGAIQDQVAAASVGTNFKIRSLQQAGFTLLLEALP